MKIRILNDKYDGLMIQITHNGYQWQNITVKTLDNMESLISEMKTYLNKEREDEKPNPVRATITFFEANGDKRSEKDIRFRSMREMYDFVDDANRNQPNRCILQKYTQLQNEPERPLKQSDIKGPVLVKYHLMNGAHVEQTNLEKRFVDTAEMGEWFLEQNNHPFLSYEITSIQPYMEEEWHPSSIEGIPYNQLFHAKIKVTRHGLPIQNLEKPFVSAEEMHKYVDQKNSNEDNYRYEITKFYAPKA